MHRTNHPVLKNKIFQSKKRRLPSRQTAFLPIKGSLKWMVFFDALLTDDLAHLLWRSRATISPEDSPPSDAGICCHVCVRVCAALWQNGESV
jgi:hypothetical protein